MQIVGPVAVLFLFLVVLLVFGSRVQKEQGQKASIENEIALADDLYKQILDMEYPDGINSVSFGKLRQRVKTDLHTYILQMQDFLSDGLSQQEYEQAASIDNPAYDYQELIANIDQYPQPLIDFLNEDSSRLAFVMDYPSHNSYQSATAMIELDEPVAQVFQLDPQWCYQPYANSIMGLEGSYPSALSAIIGTLKEDPSITPLTIGAQLASFSPEPAQSVLQFSPLYGYYYEYTEGLTDPESWLAGHYELEVQDCAADVKSIRSQLEQGRLILATLANDDNHYVVLANGQDDQVYFLDPTSYSKSGIMDLSQAVDQIKNAKAFSITD